MTKLQSVFEGMGWFERGMGQWRWVDEDEDKGQVGEDERWVGEDEDKGWVGRVACMRQQGRVLRNGSGHHRRGRV